MLVPVISKYEIRVGDWKICDTDPLPNVGTAEMRRMFGSDLAEFIGLGLHAAQQGAADIYYNGLLAKAMTMEQTRGVPLDEDESIIVGDKVVLLDFIMINEKIDWATAIVGDT